MMEVGMTDRPFVKLTADRFHTATENNRIFPYFNRQIIHPIFASTGKIHSCCLEGQIISIKSPRTVSKITLKGLFEQLGEGLPLHAFFFSGRNKYKNTPFSPFLCLSSSVMDVTSNKSAGRALLKLPHDIARQILGDVPFYRVLTIAVCLEDTEHGESFKELLRSLSLERSFFPNDQHLAYMIGLYKLYYEVLQSTTKRCKRMNHPKDSPLSLNLNVARFHDTPYWEQQRKEQRNWLLREAFFRLRSMGWSESLPIPFYVEHEKFQDPHLFERYKEYWQTVKNKHFHFATKRHSQLQTLAGILNQYPTYLKKSSDPALEARLNHTHIINQLETRAEKYQRDIRLKHPFRRETYFYRYLHLPIVPLNKDLLLFADTLARYPYNCSRLDPELTICGIADLSISRESPVQSLIYPSDVKDDINRVIHGLPHLYIFENAIPEHWPRGKLVPRTNLTECPATPESKRAAIPTCEFGRGERIFIIHTWLSEPIRVNQSADAHQSLKPVFTVPNWPHLKSQEGFGFSTVDYPRSVHIAYAY